MARQAKADAKPVEKTEETPAVTQAPLVYTKQEVLRYYSRYHDYLSVVLDSGKPYTVKEIETLIKEVR